MAGSAPSSREKVRAHRARLRAQEFRPVQIWVPDVRAPAFTESRYECFSRTRELAKLANRYNFLYLNPLAFVISSADTCLTVCENVQWWPSRSTAM